MKLAFMVTDGGAHPPEKWADATANEIVDLIRIEETAAEETKANGILEKREFGARLLRPLLAGFQAFEADEALPGDDEIKTRIETAIAAVAHAAQGTMFAQHFLEPERVLFLRDLFLRRFSTASKEYLAWKQQGSDQSEQDTSRAAAPSAAQQ
jgi:hypothetical protein